MTESKTPLAHSGRIVLITGANKGIGRETARQLGRLGMTVLAGARDEERGRRAVAQLRGEGADVRFVQLDVTEDRSVMQAAEWIDKEFGRLDVLINNAGMTVDEERPSKERLSSDINPLDTTAEHVRRTYEVNVFGVVRVTRAMLPLLRQAKSARIVNLSSPLASLTFRANPEHPIAKVGLLAYNSSKAAVSAITLQYANALRGAGILVNAANPGFVATDLNTHSGHGTVEQGASAVVRLATLADDGPSGAFLGEDGPVPW